MPKVVLLGRPNVGKSTLFNRLIRSNRAITHDRPGITRDRMEGVVKRWGEQSFLLVDTGGITLDGRQGPGQGPEGLRGFEAAILEQARQAVRESDLLCLVADAREGLSPLDGHMADFLRRTGKPLLFVLNKVDGPEKEDLLSADFHSLGLSLICCSAAHGYNLDALEEEMRAHLFPCAEESEEEDEYKSANPAGEGGNEPGEAGQLEDCAPYPLRLALIGRPNAGKSSLLNALLGAERMLVSDIAGTTRDSVDVSLTVGGRDLVFVDTAGIRRRTKISDVVERYSVSSSLKSSAKAQVTLLVIDAGEGLTQQDKHLIELLYTHKRAFMILVNKSDLIARGQSETAKKGYARDLNFCPYAPLLFVSAKKGRNLQKIVPAALELREECLSRIGTGALNRAMAEVVERRQAPMGKHGRVKFFYLTQAESDPPTFVFFVNDPERIQPSYGRYLEKSLRAALNIKHAPMRIVFRPAHEKRSDSRAAARTPSATATTEG
ncbi:MAG: ribosome biogenesis GTPase Der [Desulfovibrio sp.]|jgi:GTP-binding protein|nr:ribosome biogenesis GTPase Der [Desulfovibrio sp.]